jgi:DNA-binding helix-turn-helix protein|nr:MAG TPA: putative zinc finger/helix-turn-helix protein, YgiT family [Caudoviricetes sp.]
MKEVINMNISVKNKKRIGQDIIELRLALGENQKQFATRFNVSQNSVSLWEKGKAVQEGINY